MDEDRRFPAPGGLGLVPTPRGAAAGGGGPEAGQRFQCRGGGEASSPGAGLLAPDRQ